MAAADTVRQPDTIRPINDDAAEIELNHSHIVLVPGNSWGGETPWLSRVAAEISSGMPSATMVINGGTITLNDALASLAARRPVVVLAGSGRSADEIADARSGAPVGEKATEIAASALTTVAPVKDPKSVPGRLADILERDLEAD